MSSHPVTFDDLELTPQRVYDAMGYRGTTPDEAIQRVASELLEELRQVVKPAYTLQVFDGETLHDSLMVNGVEFKTGRTLSRIFSGAKQFVIFLVTAGADYETWAKEVKTRDDIMIEFVADAIGSAVAMSMDHCITSEMRKRFPNETYTYTFSPGQCDWDISEQQKLFSLLGDDTCGVSLTPSHLMHPIKSVTGLIGVGNDVMTTVTSCSLCPRTDCFSRNTTGAHS